ncbi:hypothetical protein NE237_008153 [Protea cynaroides]|uniref:Uncharacterized protein n=1 Tax=Protea cynaroides TaxID=273540 RepID=A0A9Q0KRI7_9MAGN|nr:hypothetical protein NE237_008153 [Protea cynaroides]
MSAHVNASSSKDFVLIVSPSNGSVISGILFLLKSVAFINGIEVISVPDGQFPSTVSIPIGSIPANVALGTAYRINMGGPLLTHNNDSLWRMWEPDYPFLLNSASARNVPVDPSFFRYPAGVTVEIAPNVFMLQCRKWQMQMSVIRDLTSHGRLESMMASPIQVAFL